MKQFWTVYLPREQVRAYADKTEPTKYPEKFAEFVESSALAKANAENSDLKAALIDLYHERFGIQVRWPGDSFHDYLEAHPIIEALSEVQK